MEKTRQELKAERRKIEEEKTFMASKKQIDAGQYMPVQLSALTGELSPEATFEALGFLPVYYSPYFKLVTPERVKACHDKNVKLMPWTVNEISDMKKMKELGTDGLITDYPDRVKSIQ